MLALETKQSGGKLLQHSVLLGGIVSRGTIPQKAKRVKIGTWNVGRFYRAGSFKAAARE